MTHLLLQILMLLSCACFAISSERHRFDFFLELHSRRLAIKWLAWAMLAVSFYFSQLKFGTALGSVYFTGHASFACGVIHLLLITRKRLNTKKM